MGVGKRLKKLVSWCHLQHTSVLLEYLIGERSKYGNLKYGNRMACEITLKLLQKIVSYSDPLKNTTFPFLLR